jgi:hypothetical protein
VDFPYVLVRLPCDTCKRAGSYAHTTEARDRADGRCNSLSPFWTIHFGFSL